MISWLLMGLSFTLLIAGWLGWLGWRLIRPLGLEGSAHRAAWGVWWALALVIAGAMVLRYVVGAAAWVIALQWIGFTLMGFWCLLTGLVLGRDALLLIARLGARLAGAPEGQGLRSPERRRFLTRSTNAALVAGAAALSADGVRRARRTAAVVDVTVPIADLPQELDGLVIVQLSDIHVGDTIGRSFVRRIVDRVATLDADLIVITGDLVDGRVRELRDDVAPIAELIAPLGVYFITGNHEYYSGAEAWVDHLRSLGIRVLVDQHEVLEHRGARLVLAGIADHDAPRFVPGHLSDPAVALAGAPADVPRILLAHQPRDYAIAQGLGVDLQLSGHTHGGQIWPFGLLVPLQQRFVAGLHRLPDGGWLYVSRGTGYWGPPMRVGAPSEITRLTLRRAGGPERTARTNSSSEGGA
mgnify:CR=1 FL=1